MWVYGNADELYHYGVPGMKWGVKKAKEDYKTAKKERRSAEKEFQKASRYAFGIKRIDRAVKAESKRNAANVKALDAEIKYKKEKAKTNDKADRAEFKAYVKEMGKHGLRNSAADRVSGGASTAVYNQAVKKKGKEYADRVEKKLEKRYITQLVGSAVVGVGAAVVGGILTAKNQ